MKTTEPSLLSRLQALELEIHRHMVRGDVARLDALLHEEFHEIGSSGATYAKADVLSLLPSADRQVRVVAGDFHVRALAADVALLTYRSAHGRPDGTLHRHSLRSSIWQRCDVGWQMIFHQGTPAEP